MLSSIHPLAKLVVCIAWIGASIAVFDARFQLAAIVLCVLALVVLEKRSPLAVLALMVPFALFGFGFLTTSLLFRQESGFALQMAKEAPMASEAFSAGITLFLRAVACGMISALFALTTDPGALIKALMANCRLSPRIGYSLFSVLQLVPDLGAEAQQIRLARAMKRGKPPSRFPNPAEAMTLLVPLLAYAIRRANRAAIALEARGLGVASPRTIIGAPRSRPRDVVFLAVTLAMLAFCAAWVRL
ncbi:putative HMP/thiamine permease protein YkoC [Mesorhizobium sp. L-8-10]|uniref:energy-coupling factor transporter transmembrane component T family protein n=1 Tax=unclassified Mesorhizobium TaxID=325217 RepID=UPI0019255A57|nr:MULTISPECIES: energy-coupling factor transporter transmembrane component T [unclassified Mesorhizobium]BCH25878.1 putative HMP/thiamine permease protein YkoC [Mesorhizobium sp. L-8-3]BCH33862.1 putative HMP/thiamine permease protein YkoC [Mesorhizobium sp. L-8-10]